MGRMTLTMKPTGWFQIGWSSDLPAAGVRPMRYFGRDLVAFRDAHGDVHVLDAYCRHLGAHLGHGGTVEGDCIVCPFHGWRWNGEGRNTHIPYQPDRPNTSRRLTSWPVREHNEALFVWHDVLGRPPMWELPNVFTDVLPHTAALDYHPAAPKGLVRYESLTLHPQMVTENAADPIHFHFVHQLPHMPVFLRRWENDHQWFSQIGFGRKWVEFEPDSHDGDTLAIVQSGVGLSYTSLSGRLNTLILLSTTPIDDHTSDMFQMVWLERLDGDDEPGVLDQRMEQATSQLRNDILVWTHQRYEDPPALATSEGRAFNSLRNWSQKFYPVEPVEGAARPSRTVPTRSSA